MTDAPACLERTRRCLAVSAERQRGFCSRASACLVFLSVSHAPALSQRAAIEADPKPLLVVAGPGSGKTFCLIERIRLLIEAHAVGPEHICAFTFTNKAAEEIADRLDQLGPSASLVKRTTIHKFCVDLLREHGRRVRPAA